MKPMDHIAMCVGWVAITAARLETVVGVITVQVLGHERSDELLGRAWSYIYDDAKKAYRDLHSKAVQIGDNISADACAAFTTLLHEANQAMNQRHQVALAVAENGDGVLHSVWTANQRRSDQRWRVLRLPATWRTRRERVEPGRAVGSSRANQRSPSAHPC